MKLVWTDPAITDRLAIYDYIDVDNPRAVAEWDNLFVRAAEQLRTHPVLGRNASYAEFR